MTRVRYIGAIVFVVGAIILISALGIGNYNFIDAFARLWPLVLINIGVNMLFKKKRIFVKAVLIFSVCFYFLYAVFSPVLTPAIEENLAEASYELKLNSDDAVAVRAAEPSSKLLSATLNVKDFDVEAKFNSAEASDFSIAQSYFEDTSAGGDWALYEIGDIDSSSGYKFAELSLDSAVKWDINLETFNLHAFFDVSDVVVNSMTIDSFGTDVELKFNEQAKTNIVVQSTDTKIRLVVPRSLGIKVMAQVIDLNVPLELERVNDAYQNKQFAKNGGIVFNINSVDTTIKIDYID